MKQINNFTQNKWFGNNLYQKIPLLLDMEIKNNNMKEHNEDNYHAELIIIN